MLYVRSTCKWHTIPQLEGFPPEEPPFLASLPERCSNLLYKRRPCTSFFPHLVRFPSSLFLLANTQQNSLLFYLGAAFSGRPCHHHPLLVPNHPPLVPTTRQNMPGAQNNPSSINVNLPTDMRKTSLPNLSYPIRPIHTPWVEPSAPLVIMVRYFQWVSCSSLTFFRVQKTESHRYQTSFVYSNGSSGVSRNSCPYFSRTYHCLARPYHQWRPFRAASLPMDPKIGTFANPAFGKRSWPFSFSWRGRSASSKRLRRALQQPTFSLNPNPLSELLRIPSRNPILISAI